MAQPDPITHRTDATRPDEIARVFVGFTRGDRHDVEAVSRWIRAIVRRGNWRFPDADGVVQEILVKLFEIARAGRVEDPESFKKFVYSVSKHVCTRTYYRQRRDPDQLAPDREQETVTTDGNPHGDLLAGERLETMIYVFQRLPEQCRTLWTLLYADGLSAGDVAAKLDITANNVRVRAHRCLVRAQEICKLFGSWESRREGRA